MIDPDIYQVFGKIEQLYSTFVFLIKEFEGRLIIVETLEAIHHEIDYLLNRCMALFQESK